MYTLFIFYLSIFYFTDAVSAWRIVFKYYLFIVSISYFTAISASFVPCPKAVIVSSLYKYASITVVADISLRHGGLKFDLLHAPAHH